MIRDLPKLMILGKGRRKETHQSIKRISSGITHIPCNGGVRNRNMWHSGVILISRNF
jgi:hypothetical protein